MARLEVADRVWSIARPLAWLPVAAALIAPAVAMQFTGAVRWTPIDFVAAATLLIGGGLLCEGFAWRVRNGVARSYSHWRSSRSSPCVGARPSADRVVLGAPRADGVRVARTQTGFRDFICALAVGPTPPAGYR